MKEYSILCTGLGLAMSIVSMLATTPAQASGCATPAAKQQAKQPVTPPPPETPPPPTGLAEYQFGYLDTDGNLKMRDEKGSTVNVNSPGPGRGLHVKSSSKLIGLMSEGNNAFILNSKGEEQWNTSQHAIAGKVVFAQTGGFSALESRFIFITSDRNLYLTNRQGGTIWSSLSGNVKGEPTSGSFAGHIVEARISVFPDSQRVVFKTDTNHLYILNANDGAEIWSTQGDTDDRADIKNLDFNKTKDGRVKDFKLAPDASVIVFSVNDSKDVYFCDGAQSGDDFHCSNVARLIDAEAASEHISDHIEGFDVGQDGLLAFWTDANSESYPRSAFIYRIAKAVNQRISVDLPALKFKVVGMRVSPIGNNVLVLSGEGSGVGAGKVAGNAFVIDCVGSTSQLKWNSSSTKFSGKVVEATVLGYRLALFDGEKVYSVSLAYKEQFPVIDTSSVFKGKILADSASATRNSSGVMDSCPAKLTMEVPPVLVLPSDDGNVHILNHGSKPVDAPPFGPDTIRSRIEKFEVSGDLVTLVTGGSNLVVTTSDGKSVFNSKGGALDNKVLDFEITNDRFAVLTRDGDLHLYNNAGTEIGSPSRLEKGSVQSFRMSNQRIAVVHSVAKNGGHLTILDRYGKFVWNSFDGGSQSSSAHLKDGEIVDAWVTDSNVIFRTTDRNVFVLDLNGNTICDTVVGSGVFDVVDKGQVSGHVVAFAASNTGIVLLAKDGLGNRNAYVYGLSTSIAWNTKDWKTDKPITDLEKYKNEGSGQVTSALISKNRVLIQVEGSLFLLDSKDGAMIWNSASQFNKDNSFPNLQILDAVLSNKTVAFRTAKNALYLLNSEDGSEIWKSPENGSLYRKVNVKSDTVLE